MKKIFLLAFAMLFVNTNFCQAYEVQVLDNTPVAGDFVLGPGKADLSLKPGDKNTQQIIVTNRLGEDRKFKVEVEDFSGSYNTDETVVFFGDAKGPYSLKDYIKPEITEFSLKHGERIVIPVEISIPADSEPGGLYASVLVSTVPGGEETAKNQGKTKVVSRLGTLFFVRVEGNVKEAGVLQDFKAINSANGFYEKAPIPFQIIFKNEGNIHLVPSGKIELKNLWGKKIGEMKVDKYFAMPNSLRERVVNWETGFLLGRYTATLTLDKNYQQEPNEPEIRAVSFWVIPWKILLAALAVIAVAVFLLKLILSKFKFEIKKK